MPKTNRAGAEDLLKRIGVTDFEINDDIVMARSLNFGELAKLVIYDRFIGDGVEFAKLGYQVVCRERKNETP